MPSSTYADILEAHASAFLARAVKWVDANEPWGTLAAGARADPGVQAARALGAWVAEDLVTMGGNPGAAQAADVRQRSALAERTVAEALAALAAQGAPDRLSPAAAEARESLIDAMGGESDALTDALQRGFLEGSGAPLVNLRRPLTLEDLAPEGSRVQFLKPVAPPPGFVLEPVAQLRQDVARLKHYALREALGRTGRPLSVAASSSFFKVVRPPVSLDGDLAEFRALSGCANAADAWADEVRDGLLQGFLERVRTRQKASLIAAPADPRGLLRALELERAAADLKGALAHDPDAAIIPAEGLLALIIAAPLPTGGLTP